MVLQACPDIVDYAKGGEISCWRDLISAAATVRSALGVSPDAWSQALEALGEHDASIVIAAIVDFGFKVRPKGIRRAFLVSFETGCQFESQLKPKIGRVQDGAGGVGRCGKRAASTTSRVAFHPVVFNSSRRNWPRRSAFCQRESFGSSTRPAMSL
jgi:Replication protein C C-terminal region